jgi:HSP20 family protein
MRFMTGTPDNSIARFDSGFDHLLRGFLGIDENSQGVYSVHMDLVEGRDGFRIFVDLPRMEKDKIKVLVENNLLTISGERTREENGDNRLVLSERFYGSFSRSFRLPDTIDKTGVSADYRDGILEIFLPRKEETKPKEIEVKVK